MSVQETTIVDRKCRHCRHFRNDAAYLESAFPGLTSMSSGYGSVRAEDGICLVHDRYLNAESSCPQFRSRRAKFSLQPSQQQILPGRAAVKGRVLLILQGLLRLRSRAFNVMFRKSLERL